MTSGDRPVRGRTAGFRDTAQRAAHTADMPVRLRHIVVDAHDLPGLVRFWTQALGWNVLSERENEIVIGTDENAPVGMCFMPVTDPKTVKNRVHLDLTSSAADRDQEIDRLLALGPRRVDIGQTGAESWTVLASARLLTPSLVRYVTSSPTSPPRCPEGASRAGHTGRNAAICSLSQCRRALGTQMVAAGSSVAGSW
jgi:hypothetical protein